MGWLEETYGAGILGLNRLAAGSGLTEQKLKRHLAGKPYNNQTIVNNSVSDATDGYHIRSGKDYGQLAEGNLPLGGIPAALAGLAYQQITGIKDSSLFGGNGNIFGTVGPSAFLQAVDNIEGLRQSGNAPALDALYEYGNNFNSPDYKVDRRGRRLDGKGLFNTQGKNFIKDRTKEIRKDAKSKAKSVMKTKDEDGNLMYPNAKEDLLSHYFASQTMSGKWGVGMPISLALGLIKEIGDSQRVPYFNPKKGYFEKSTGFSVDDLGANWAGATGMSFDEAYNRGMFSHTETVPQNNDWSQDSKYGFGQGEWRKVMEKLGMMNP